MSLEYVVGAAAIWCFFIALGLFALWLVISLTLTALTYFRCHPMAWRFGNGSYVTEDELDDWLTDPLRGLVQQHAHERCWSRSSDMREAAQAAVKYLLRDRGVTVIRRRNRRTRGKALELLQRVASSNRIADDKLHEDVKKYVDMFAPLPEQRR